MKKTSFVKLILLLLLLMPIASYAETLTYDEATEAIKQSIQAWYMRGSYRQYNSSKNTYGDLRHPEDATSQDTGYSVCSGFTNDAIMEAFGFQAGSDDGKTPAGSTNYCIDARNYIDTKNCKTSNSNKTGCKGEYVIYYYHKADGINYYYNPKGWTTDTPDLTDFLNLLQPGDILSYNGHVVILYDFKYDSKGNRTDALLFESVGGGLKVFSKIDPDNSPLHRLFYHKVKNQDTNGLLDINTSYMPYEGTVRWKWLSKYTVFVKSGKLSCQKDMCSITRGFYKDSSGNAAFNFDVEWPEQIKTSKARNALPGIFITKTSSKYDNNSVVLGDTIKYTIQIYNNSNLVKVNGKEQGKKYANFHIKETIPNEVEFVSATFDESPKGTYDESSQTITWDISELAAGESITIKYSVKVKKETSNIGKFVEASGKVYKTSANYIPTGVVRNEIIQTTSKTDQEYVTCYNQMKSAGKKSLDLIQKTYECVHGKDLGFDFEDFSETGDKMLDQLVYRSTANPKNGTTNLTRLKTTGDNKIYADMVLNNYWNGLILTNYGSTDGSKYYIFPRWRKTDTSSYIGEKSRAQTIMSGHFKTGDVLIYSVDKNNTKTSLQYTAEDGIYAFIFIDGKFVGVNYSGSKARNEFTDDYYTDKAKNLYDGSSSYYTYANYQTLFGKDAYVILRPEKVITEVTSIKIKKLPTKLTYFQKETLDLTGGTITITNNDGTTKDVDMTSSEVKVTGYNPKIVGEQTLTVTYSGKTKSFKVTVEEATVTSIEVKTAPTKTTYFVGEELNLNGGIIKANYSNGTSQTYSMSNSSIKVTGFDSSHAGDNTLTITYSNKTTTMNVQIVNVLLQTISIQKYPDKIVYTKGEDLDLTGGVIQKYYNNGIKMIVSMTDASITISGYNKEQVGTQTISILTEGKTLTMDVIVNKEEEGTPTLESISIYSNPTKQNYHIGETLNLDGGKIKARYIQTIEGSTIETIKVIEMSDSNVTVSGFSSIEEGEKTVTVQYQSLTTSFKVMVSKVEKKIKKIEITKYPKKKKYVQYRENLDETGGELTATYTDGTTAVVSLKDAEVTVLDFDNTQLGEQQIHVIYKGLETSFPIVVQTASEEEIEEEDNYGPIQKIEVIEEPKKVVYLQGKDEFDISGVILKVQYEDGTERIIDLLEYPGRYTITGFDNKVVGEQNVIINYQGYQIALRVEVKPNSTIVLDDVPDTFASKPLIQTILGVCFLLFGSSILYKTIKKNS